MTISHLSAKVRAFCTARDWDQFHGPKDLAIGLATESAELLALFRFLTEEQARELLSSPEGREKIGDELADVLFFLLRFADRCDFNLADALNAKLAKNELRYPAEKARGRNVKYDKL